ncbi:glycoside hydrolase family 28 protein [Actinophytocola algeriensis]|uniref:Polygalacturonase n=1 Tax=Actinophytocola algeriensis TaxID=1768010 RepID=A0A7W7QA04_9PSEU|nr:glycoside hydrolase family 28 protein [Actinophytocola algeriensis]MBB4909603.1 polygalacturonase [Actinophytocola algeriensis]MBE1475593.1 polygalacturonase [Actinophytocola algeriensis]
MTRFGAKGDGVTDCTIAFARAVRACAHAGGGHVVVPAGRYLTGPIHLRGNVDLHVTADATIAFSQDPDHYLPAVFTRWEGTELYNYSPLIYAFEQHDIAVTGTGTLDGQADNAHWWPWKGNPDYGWQPGDPHQADARARLFAMAEQGVPVAQRVFGAGDYLRPSFVQPYRCRNVLVEGVTIVNSPMWEVHPVLSRNVLVRDVTVATHGPNNDGCNPESSKDVVIRGCTFDTGDDCIAVKSGRNADGRRVNVPSERILVEDCDFAAGHGGVTVGSEMSGGVRDVYARDLRLSSPDLDTALRFKTNSVRGGFIHDVHARDITVGTVAQAVITIDFYYEEGPGHGFNPDVTGITAENLTVAEAGRALNLRGYPDNPVGAIHLTNVDFLRTAQPSIVENVSGLELTDVYENGAPMEI